MLIWTEIVITSCTLFVWVFWLTTSYLFGNVLAGEQKFLCPLCGKGYTTRRGMKTHINYHSDARPHVCTICGAGFKARGKLYDHMKLVHTELVTKITVEIYFVFVICVLFLVI